jgi:hypothetical protein
VQVQNNKKHRFFSVLFSCRKGGYFLYSSAKALNAGNAPRTVAFDVQ